MNIKSLRCKKCKRLLLNKLSGAISFDNSTNMLSLVPKDDDVVLEIRCPRCKKYYVIFKLGGEEIEYGDERRDQEMEREEGEY
jgi:phage FluMu protein Com